LPIEILGKLQSQPGFCNCRGIHGEGLLSSVRSPVRALGRSPKGFKSGSKTKRTTYSAGPKVWLRGGLVVFIERIRGFKRGGNGWGKASVLGIGYPICYSSYIMAQFFGRELVIPSKTAVFYFNLWINIFFVDK
jgi:hypothetical protein